MHRSLLSAVLSLSLLLSPLVAAQDVSYTFTDVPRGTPYGLNDNGQIVGIFWDATSHYGFLTDDATFTTIRNFGPWTVAYDINDSGQIVGSFHDGTRWRGFLTDGTTYTTIIAVPGATGTQALGINDSGQVVGWFSDPMGNHGFLTNGVAFTTLDVPGARVIYAYDINNNGQIVGWSSDGTMAQGFLRDGDTFTTINIPGATVIEAHGINNNGQIVGWLFDSAGRSHSFLATPIVDTAPPVVTIATSPATLSPPNGRLVTVTVSGTITDGTNGSGVQASTYQVTDEYGKIQPSGSVPLGANSQYVFTVALEASRRGNDQNGRHYMIAVSAKDIAGKLGVASATVTVPHN